MVSKHRARLVPRAPCHPLDWLMLTPYKDNHVSIVSARSSEQGVGRTVGTSPRWRADTRAQLGIVDDKGSTRLSPSPVLRVSGLGPDESGASSAMKSSTCSRSGLRNYPVDAHNASMADLRKHNQVQQLCRRQDTTQTMPTTTSLLPPGWRQRQRGRSQHMVLPV